MNLTKLDQAYFDSPCRELSNGCLGNVAARFWFAGKLIFRVLVLGVQFSCSSLV